MTLFFDTETTGKADFKSPPEADHQPRLVQLACLLQDDNARTVGSLNLIIQPDGVEIPAAAVAVHGIDSELAVKVGVRLETAMELFGQLLNAATTCVCYNVDFDALIMRHAAFLVNGDSDIFPSILLWSDPMHDATAWCRLPGPYGFKRPKLSEAYAFFFSTLVGAHNAMADVTATARLYWLLKRIGQPAS